MSDTDRDVTEWTDEQLAEQVDLTADRLEQMAKVAGADLSRGRGIERLRAAARRLREGADREALEEYRREMASQLCSCGPAHATGLAEHREVCGYRTAVENVRARAAPTGQEGEREPDLPGLDREGSSEAGERLKEIDFEAWSLIRKLSAYAADSPGISDLPSVAFRWEDALAKRILGLVDPDPAPEEEPEAWLPYAWGLGSGALKKCPQCGTKALEGQEVCGECGGGPYEDESWRETVTDRPAPEDPERTYGLADARCGNPACQCADPAPEEGSEAQLDVEGAMERVKVEYRRHARAERWEEAHTLHEAIQVLEAALADHPAPEGPDPGDLEWAEETVSEAIGEMGCGDRHVAPEDASEAWFDILRPYLRRLRASRPSSGDGEAVAWMVECDEKCDLDPSVEVEKPTDIDRYECGICGRGPEQMTVTPLYRAAPPEGEEVGE